MSEENQQKKQAGLIRRIFRWFGIGILVLLIILALLFKAPWRITGVLFIFLATLTILPGPYRKWFWACVGIVVLAMVIWVFMPDETQGWRPYTFDDELAAMEAQYTVADEENAALIYDQLLNSDSDFEPNFPDSNQYEQYYNLTYQLWKSIDYPQTAAWLAGQQETIALLLEASKFQKCHFPICAELTCFGEQMERLSPVRRWGYLLAVAGNNDLAEGRDTQALEKYLAMLRIAEHIHYQLTTIDKLVGIAIEALAHGRLREFIVNGNPTPRHLETIAAAINELKTEWNSELPAMIQLEKLYFKNLQGMMLYEVNNSGRIRFARNPMATIRRYYEDEFSEECSDEDGSLFYWCGKLWKAHTILFWLSVPSDPLDAGKVIDQSYDRYYTMLEPDYDWNHQAVQFKVPTAMSSFMQFQFNFSGFVEKMAETTQETYYSLHDIYLRLDMDRRSTRIIITMASYKDIDGNWPENLDELAGLTEAENLIDPVNNGPFVYRKTAEGFTLYSTGKNGIDEGGEYKSDFTKDLFEPAEPDDRMIWPKKKCESEEQDDDPNDQQ